MRLITCSLLILLFSCNQAEKKEPAGRDSVQTSIDTLPDLTVNPGATAVNRVLETQQGNWHLMTDPESGWTKDALEYFVYPKRKTDPDYPYISRGDYNCDGKPDIAAVVTDSSTKKVKLAFIYGDNNEVDWYSEDMAGAAIQNMTKQDFGAMKDEKEIRVSLNCDAVEAEWFEKATQVIYRKGKAFDNVWTAD